MTVIIVSGNFKIIIPIDNGVVPIIAIVRKWYGDN